MAECYEREALATDREQLDELFFEVTMAEKKSIDWQLRAIGQSLEAQRIRVFKLSQQNDRFVVTGEPEKEDTLLAKLRRWQQRNRQAGMNSSLTFTPQDLEQLDRQGRAQRVKPGRLPDFHSLGNTLRTVGSHLEAKGAELIELQKKELSIMIVARNKSGHPEIEERSLGSFYDLFTRLHAQRKTVRSKE
jgi:hypothetical protein